MYIIVNKECFKKVDWRLKKRRQQANVFLRGMDKKGQIKWDNM